MKLFKLLFSISLLLMAGPVWRLIDWANVLIPIPHLYKFVLAALFLVFLLLPLKLLLLKFSRKIAMALAALLAALISIFEPLSSQTVLEPANSHCGVITYTGFFYPARSLLSPSYQDDLELRNQLCWVTKMIKKTPAVIPAEEFELQLNLLKSKLSKPNIKYRSSLPWITFLLGSYFSSTSSSESKIEQMQNANLFSQSLRYYTHLYGDEISGRKYQWFEWPHSALIQAEYGFIERNWEHIHIQLNK